MKRAILLLNMMVLIAIASTNVSAQSDLSSLDDLLKTVQSGKVTENTANKQREQDFIRNKANQQQTLAEANQERAAAEAQSAGLEAEFEVNEAQLVVLREQLAVRMGSLKELFGVLQQAAGDARGQFQNSLTNIEFPNRGEFLTTLAEKMGSSSELASLEEIEQLWFELQREMTEQGKIKKITAQVVSANGDQVQKEILRVGVFNIVSDGKYLGLNPDTGTVSELQRQPAARFRKTAEEINTATSGVVAFGLDPSRGQLLSMLIQTPTFEERIGQGGLVGHSILVLGAIAAVVAIYRFILLMMISARVTAQKRNTSKPDTSNPLGRVLQVYHQNRNIDLESLELRLGEAVMKETPELNRFNTLLKVIAVMSPLLGLLGTVTGMIITFQAITLFGAGDPKMMAGGISQALVTTIEGLCVAIPTVLLHTIVSGRSKALVETLEEQATGMIAEYSEKIHKAA